MDEAVKSGEDLWQGLARHGIAADAFDFRGQLAVDCPYCGEAGTMKLSKSTYRAKCSSCHVDAKLVDYVDRLDRQAHGEPDREEVPDRPDRQQKTDAERAEEDRFGLLIAEENARRARQAKIAEKAQRQGQWGERIIMSALALVFLLAGLAAAGLSGFANYQAFSDSVTDPVQGRIWGWSGVIASVCSFGGFTFFWWHASAKRFSEAGRALVFALAGAGTSIAGTALFMANSEGARATEQLMLKQRHNVIVAQIDDWTRQLDGIPTQTRTVEGLELYLAGVEQAGRTHQKPYRDAQNELGLAKRRDGLEANIADARQSLLEVSGAGALDQDSPSIPPWFFAIMLELFSSQGTSIAFVSLLLLYGRKTPQAG
ncbi:MAG: hypothetical protein AAGA24_03630 [Pseudomonadota bacterium]